MISFQTINPKIGIFRALQLGDLLCSVPALRSLRRAFPLAEIVWIGLPWTADFVKRFHRYVDRCIVFPGYPGLPEQEFKTSDWDIFERQMTHEKFDLLIQIHGKGTIVNKMLSGFRARDMAGYHTSECRMDSPNFMEYPSSGHEINRHLQLMQFLGIASTGPELEFPIEMADKDALQKLKSNYQIDKYICVHPGSRGSWRQWPPDCFAALADLYAEKRYQIIITGTADELPIAVQVKNAMKLPSMNLAGATNLGTVAAVIGKASLLIANCTGVSHIAAALHTPSLVISMDGEPQRWGPLDHHLHRTIDWTATQDLSVVRETLFQLLKQIEIL